MAETVSDLLVKVDVDAARFRTEIERSVRAPLRGTEEAAGRARTVVRQFGDSAGEAGERLSGFSRHGGTAESAIGRLAQRIREYRAEETQEARTARFFSRELGELLPEGAGTAAKALGVLATATGVVGLAFGLGKAAVEALVASYAATRERTEALAEAQKKYRDIAVEVFPAVANQAEEAAERTGRKFKDVLDESLKDFQKFGAEAQKILDNVAKGFAQENLTPAQKQIQDALLPMMKQIEEEQEKLNALQKEGRDHFAELALHEDQGAALMKKIADQQTIINALQDDFNKKTIESARLLDQEQKRLTAKNNIQLSNDAIEAQAKADKDREEKAARLAAELKRKEDAAREAIERLVATKRAELEGLRAGGGAEGEHVKFVLDVDSGDIAKKLDEGFKNAPAKAAEYRQILKDISAEMRDQKNLGDAFDAARAIGDTIREIEAKTRGLTDATTAHTVATSLNEGALRKHFDVLKAEGIEVGDLEEHVLRSARAFDSQKKAIEDAKKEAEDYEKKMGELEQQTARVSDALFDSFADNLFKPFDEGLRGMLESFGKAIAQMLLEAAKANFASAIFGGIRNISEAQGIGLQGLAEGGPASASTPYIVGERGPEIFVPSVSGHIVSNDEIADASLARGRAGGGVMRVEVDRDLINVTVRDLVERALADEAAKR